MTASVGKDLSKSAAKSVGAFDGQEAPQLVTSANMFLWLREVYVVTGSGVSQWTDKSGNGRHASQSTDADRPQVTALAGQTAMDFDGLDYWFTFAADFTGMTASEAFFICKNNHDPADNANRGGWGDFCSDGQDQHHPHTDGVIYDGFGSTARKSTGNPSAALDSNHLYNVISTSSEWTANINGTQHYTTATNTVGWPTAGNCMFGRSQSTTNHWEGQCAEIIIYDAKLSTADRDAIEAYVNARYGI